MLYCLVSIKWLKKNINKKVRKPLLNVKGFYYMTKENTKEEQETLDYEVIATGSSGNAVRIDDILIDCGIAFKRLKPHLYKVKTLLITHKHSDHLKPTTLKAIKKNFPNIQVVSNYEVKQLYPDYIDIVANAKYPFYTYSGIITPFECVHDCVCLGYSFIKNGKKVVYATDTTTMKNCPTDIPIDYCFLESNYCEIKVKQIIETTDVFKKYGYDIRQGTERHLSKQQCKAFFYAHRASDESILIPLHQSKRFL